MRTNKISGVLTDAVKAQVTTKVNEILILLPMLINLTVEERKNLKGIGNKNLAYVKKCLEGALAFPNELKVNFDVAEYQKDVNLFESLLGIHIVVQALLEKIDDSIKASGIDSMKSSSEVYDSLKSSAKNNANVKSIVDEIAVRFKGQGKAKTPPAS